MKTFQMVNNLRDIAVISLASELEHLVHVLGILSEATGVLILVFNIYLHFDGLAINGDPLTLAVVDKSLVDKLIEQDLGNVIV